MRSAIAVALLVGRTAFAEAPSEVPAKPAPHKSLVTAYAISIAATGLPLVAGAIGAGEDDRGARANAFGVLAVSVLVLGPSAGHWYAGEGVTTGLVLRAGGVAGFAALAIYDPHLDHPATTIVGLAAAIGLYETGLIWDAVTMPRAVRHFNQEHALALVPLVTSQQTSATGLAIAGAF